MTLGEEIRILEKLSEENPRLGFGDRIDSLYREYHFMFEYMKKGYPDPKRQEIYDLMKKRAWMLKVDLQLEKHIANDSYFSELRKALKTIDTSSSDLIALLEKSGEKDKSYYTTLSLVFNAIFLSGQWHEQDSRLWTAFFLGTDINTEAGCVVISAITLSCRLAFSMEKFRTLANVYMMSDNEAIRQRALVGWCFSFDMGITEFRKEQQDVLSQLADDGDKTSRNILEMLMQIVRCNHAEKDDKRFQTEIMPELMKGQPVQITKNGTIEKIEDPMEDILNPGASEKRMEEMEKSLRKVLSMQQEGSDLYYQGFAQTKRYPFFYNLMNWFLPYSNNIPEVKDALSRLDTADFVKRVAEKGPFCDSDKFSFVFTISHVMGSISDDIKKMMNAGELAPVGMTEDAEERQKDPAFIQRVYLQDLYRFFKLFPRHSFPSIFEKQKNHIIDIFSYLGKDMQSLASEYASFLIRKEESQEVTALFRFFDIKNYNDNIVMAAFYQSTESYKAACDNYENAIEIDADNDKAYKGLGRCAFADGNYEQAAKAYKKLKELDPENKTYAMNYVMSMVNAGNAEGMINEAYRLDFEMPDNLSVKRLVGWTLLMSKRLDKAEQVLSDIVNDTYMTHSPSDCLNFAYAKLFSGDTLTAISLLKDYVNSEYKEKSLNEKLLSLSKDIDKDNILLDKYGYNQEDINMILECLIEDICD